MHQKHPYPKCAVALSMSLFFILSVFTRVEASEQADIQTVRAGIFAFDGYHVKDEDGDLSGYGIEVLNLISAHSHLNFEYVGYDKSFSDMLDMLKSGEIDVVTASRKLPEREEEFAFSFPIGQNDTTLSIKADDPTLRADDPSTYDGMTVGVLAGSRLNQRLEDFAAEKGFSYHKREYPDNDSLTADLQAGRIDAIFSSSLRQTAGEKTLDTVGSDLFYAIVRKDDTELLDEINYALDQMNINEGDWKNDLFYRYYGNTYPSASAFTKRERTYIQDVISGKKKITVTAIGDRTPYSYVRDGRLQGILPEYFAQVMELAGLPYKVVMPKDRRDYYKLAENDGVDVVIDKRCSDEAAPVIPTSGFETDTYLTTGIAKVTRRDHTGEIRTVAITDSQGEFPIETGFTGDAQIVRYPTRDDTMRAVLDRRADAAYVYTYTAQAFVNNDTTGSLQFGIEDDIRFNFKMYVRDTCDHELVTILNKCIRRMPEDTTSQLITKYTAYAPEDMSFARYMQTHPEIMIPVTLAAALAAVLIIFFFLRSRWRGRLLQSKERSNQKLGEQLAIVDALSHDYLNIYAVDTEKDTVRIIKLEGYRTTGITEEAAEYSYTTLLHQYIRERVHADDQAGLREALSIERVTKELAEHTKYIGSYRVMMDGSVHHYQFTYVVIPKNDYHKETFALAAFRNIDDLVQKELEQKDTLEKALAQAQAANAAKTRFLNNMSHDIRTPMNAIIGFANLALSHLDDPDRMEDHLNKILTSSKHLLNLINDVLDMSHIESGKIRLEEQTVDLTAVIRDLQTIIQADVRAKQIDLHVETHQMTDNLIVCDRLRLNQVLLNILSNAVKYTDSGGTIRICVTQSGGAPKGCGTYQFKIQDTGKGMSSAFLEHIFEPFEREQTSTISQIQGTGLGLAITKNLVDMMGGTIDVTSEKGVGSEFTVTFCFPITDAPAPMPEAEAGTDGLPDLLCGRKILLVEDNELNREIAQTILEGVGLIVDTANDGSVAVKIMEKAAADAYDLILMDIQMPIMDGYEAARQIRQIDDPVRSAIPIVAMTADAFEEDRQKAIDAGMNGHITKPIDVSRLMATLTEILRKDKDI